MRVGLDETEAAGVDEGEAELLRLVFEGLGDTETKNKIGAENQT